MSELLSKVYAACNPFLPANSDYYCDCRESRGGDAFVGTVINNLRRVGDSDAKGFRSKDYLRFLFSGHTGCGKSSELKHLAEKLEKEDAACYFPVYINTFDYLDVYDVSIEEILLSVVTELAETFREKLGIELENTYFQKRFEELREFFLTDVEIKEGEIGIFGSKMKVQRLQSNPDARKKVRESLQPRMSTILEEMNLLFAQARLKLRQKTVGETSVKYADFVIILDNLEKIEKYRNSREGLESFERLFIDNHSQLTGFDSHVIYTVPLELVRSGSATKLEQFYGELKVLPMVKIFDRKTRQPYADGIEAMKKIMQKRLGEVLLGEIFDEGVLEFLIKYSGGSIRDFLRFVRRASVSARDKISMDDARNSLKSSIQIHSTAIYYDSEGKPFDHWEKLAMLDLAPDQKIPDEDRHYQILLGSLNILEYLNGGSENIFEDNAPWYAVNPIDRELSQFKLAKAELEKAASRIEL